MGWIKKILERRSNENPQTNEEDRSGLLQALIGEKKITEKEATQVPSYAACVEWIANKVAVLPIRLYRKNQNGDIEEIINDNRTKLLNRETGDLLDGYQFKKAMVNDFLKNGEAYAYVNRSRNEIKSIHYVESGNVSTIIGSDPIFKDVKITVQGKMYGWWDFIVITKNTKNGVKGKGTVEDNDAILETAFETLLFEGRQVKTNGNKKGFIQTQSRLEQGTIDDLRQQWRNMYSKGTENVIVLNSGLEFKEASNTSVELQLNENKKTNAEEITSIFNLPYSIIAGGAKDEEYTNAINDAVVPVLVAFETAIDKILLLEEEKENMFFKFDVMEAFKGDMKKRYDSYDIAVERGIMKLDEVRRKENLPPLGLDFVKLGLNDVLYDPKTRIVYTPNSGVSYKLHGHTAGGEEKINDDESGITE